MITVTKNFDVTPHDLWDALTNKDSLRKWYFNIPDFSNEVGDSFHFYDPSGTYLHHCEVLESQKDILFKHSWTHPNESKGTSVVTWRIVPLGDHKTQLEFTHEGTESFQDAGAAFTSENFQAGWNELIQVNLRNFLYLIERLHFSININATSRKVWETLWSPETYSAWTAPFCEGSYYRGDLKAGSRIHFLMPAGSGMYSDVLWYKEEEKIIFKHLGEIKDFIEQEPTQETEHWTGCIESYRLLQITENTTEVIVEVDVVDAHMEFMKTKFPLAIEKLKELAEQN